MIIAVIGKNASGKTEFSNYASKKYGFHVYEIGDYVRRAYKKSDALQSLLEFSNSCFMNDKLIIFLKTAIEDVKKSDYKNIIFTGLRTYDEILYLKDVYPNAYVVQIITSVNNREKRYFKFSVDAVTSKMRDEVENRWINDNWEKIKIDYKINNDGSLKEFYKEISNLFEKIM